jgi:putative N6-adenine-specific DNA methylase
MRFLVTVSKGLEEAAAQELADLGLAVMGSSPGLVAFKGGREDAWRACLWLRTARRVLQPLGEFPAESAEALYEGARGLPWQEVMTPDHTFAVEASVRDSAFNHSGFVALKIKDAAADALREAFGRRADVDRSDPDVRVVAHISGNLCSVSLDLSGGPLHKRGYRNRSVAAPLNETLAAGILRLMGYDGSLPFADPFCGSGTLCIEAALMATHTAPGLLRKTPFGFQRWPGFDPRPWRQQLEEARKRQRRAPHSIMGSDIDREAVVAARENARAAGMKHEVTLEAQSLAAFLPPADSGLMVTNPPYGEHVGVGEDLPSLYGALGDILKRRCEGWTAGVLTGNPALGKCIGLHPKRKIALFNGPMPCKLMVFEIYPGSRKTAKA